MFTVSSVYVLAFEWAGARPFGASLLVPPLPLPRPPGELGDASPLPYLQASQRKMSICLHRVSWQRSDCCSFALVPPALSSCLCTCLYLRSHNYLTLRLWHPWERQLWQWSGVPSFASIKPRCKASSGRL